MARLAVVVATALVSGCVANVPGNGAGNLRMDAGTNGFDSGTVEGGGGDGGSGSGSANLDAVTDPLSPLLGFLTGPAQLAQLCARGNGDAVSRAFCATSTPPVIHSITDLEQLVGLGFQPGNKTNGNNGNPAFALTGHSTSLVTRFTSAINPRAIIFTPPNSRGHVGDPQALASFVALGFVRGEQFVELVSNDPTANNGQGDLDFFLFRFTQACSSTAEGCSVNDLLTPSVESNFTGYSLYQDVDVEDTIFDCLQCHQTGGAGTPKFLRMQELTNPWGHWFRNNRSNGEDMISDFVAAHGTSEDYAGIPAAALNNPDDSNNNGEGPFNGGGPDPAALEGLVEDQGFQAQPNLFDTDEILDQGESAPWLALYDRAKAAQDIPPPYHENRVTDPDLLANATAAYNGYLNGAALTVDLRDVFLASALPDLTFAPDPSLDAASDGVGIMVQMCQQCHNPSLDQTLSRAKFDVTKLSTMSAEEKTTAIQRLSLDPSVFRRMPPPRFRGLSPAEIALVTTALSQ